MSNQRKRNKILFFPQQTEGQYPGTPLPIWQCNVLTSANMDDVTGWVVVLFCYPVSVFKQSDLIHLNVIVKSVFSNICSYTQIWNDERY